MHLLLQIMQWFYIENRKHDVLVLGKVGKVGKAGNAGNMGINPSTGPYHAKCATCSS